MPTAHQPAHAAPPRIIDGNLIGPAGIALPAAPATIIAWSGHPDPDPAAFFSDDPRSWLAPALRAFDAACDALAAPLASRGQLLALRPHAAHVLCDAVRCINLLRDRAGQPFGIALDVESMLTPAMRDQAADHIARWAGLLADRSAVIIAPRDADLQDMLDAHLDDAARLRTVRPGDGPSAFPAGDPR